MDNKIDWITKNFFLLLAEDNKVDWITKKKFCYEIEGAICVFQSKKLGMFIQ